MSAVTHFGPVSFYMARVPDGKDINTWDGAGNVWFKVGEISAVQNGGAALTSDVTTWPAYSISLPLSTSPPRSPTDILTPPRQKIRRIHRPQDRPQRQVPGPRREHRAAPGRKGRRRPVLPGVRAGRGHGRREREPHGLGRVPGRLQDQRPGPAVVVLPRADELQGARTGGVAGVDGRWRGWFGVGGGGCLVV